jgi:hypothetical protein
MRFIHGEGRTRCTLLSVKSNGMAWGLLFGSRQFG